MAEPAGAPVEQVEQAAQAAPQVEGTKAFVQYLFSPETMLDRLGSVVLVAILSLLAWLAVVALTRRMQRSFRAAMADADEIQRKRIQRALTGLSLVTNVLKWTIIIGGVLAGLIALGLGPKLLPVLAGAGVLGLAIGFGAQTLVRDLIAGLFVLLEGQYGVGDFVQIGSVFGQVVSVGLRVTIVQDVHGRKHFLPNGSIGVVAVYDDPWTEYVMDVLIVDQGEAQRAVEAIASTTAALAEEYEGYFVVRGSPRILPTGDLTCVRLPVATFADQDWIAKEELVTRAKRSLERAGVKLVPERPPRVYADLARAPLAVAGPQRVEEREERDESKRLW